MTLFEQVRVWLSATAVIGAVAVTSSKAGEAEEKMFLDENNVAMARMMADMTVRPSGDVDKDFVAMMVPHHQGAVDMARTELRYGLNENLRRIAQKIIAEQPQEMDAMKRALGQQPEQAPASHAPMAPMTMKGEAN